MGNTKEQEKATQKLVLPHKIAAKCSTAMNTQTSSLVSAEVNHVTHQKLMHVTHTGPIMGIRRHKESLIQTNACKVKSVHTAAVWATRAPAATASLRQALSAHPMALRSVHPAMQAITKAGQAVWQTRAPAPTATPPQALNAHQMVLRSVHPAKHASTRAGINAYLALQIRIRTWLLVPAALATQVITKAGQTVLQTRAVVPMGTLPQVLCALQTGLRSVYPAKKDSTR